MKEKIFFNDAMLNLSDWKAVEQTAELGIQKHKMALVLNLEARKIAKEEIKGLGGKTSEEEKAAAEDNIT